MRRRDWDRRLSAAVASATDAGWGWDGRTCLHMLVDVAEGVAVAPARKHAAAMAGGEMPRTRKGLLATMARLGGLEACVAECARRCGFPEIDPRLACAGDWGVADFCGDPEDGARAEGVVKGDSVWFYRIPERGVVQIPAAVAPVRRAWAVG